MKKIAIFDFDGTITYKDSFNDFLIFTFGKKKFYKTIIKNFFNIGLYATKIRSNAKMKEKLFKSFYKGISYNKYCDDCLNYSINGLEKIIRKDVLNIIEQYNEQNVDLVILSASFKEWIEPWAKKFHFKKIISSTFTIDSKIIEGNIASNQCCYGKNKVAMLLKEYPNLSDYYIYAYGDSKADRHFLNKANESFLIK